MTNIINTSMSEGSISNLGYSDTYDISSLAKLAGDIIGDEWIT